MTSRLLHEACNLGVREVSICAMRTLLLACALVWLSPSVADACLNETFYTLDNATSEINDAELALEAGRYKRALQKAKHASTSAPESPYRIQSDTEDSGERRKGLEHRRQRVIAIAHLRLGHTTVAKRALGTLLEQKPNDPGLQARYAEALAAVGSKQKSRELLADLETRDVMPDAAAWLALAKLHDGAGDIESRDRAITGCKAIAKTKRACAFKLMARPAKVARKR